MRTSRRRLPPGWVGLTGAPPLSVDSFGHSGRGGARVAFSQTGSRGHHVSPMMLAHSSGTMLMDGHKAPMKARFPRPTASCPFYSKPHATPSYFLLFSCEAA